MAPADVPAAPDPAAHLERWRQAIASGDPALAMPALAGLREVAEAQATPLLLLGLEQSTFMIRSLACAGLGVKRSEAGWQALERCLSRDEDANVRAEAANALASYGVERSWPLLRAAFAGDGQWLVRCSILSALAEQPEMPPPWLLELARLAIADGDGTVRVGGAEILGRLVREGAEGAEPLSGSPADQARGLLRELQADPDHRVVAAALDGLQG
ncbi:MAG: HEAT repeat domain-containing protein [Cyanobium sp.]